MEAPPGAEMLASMSNQMELDPGKEQGPELEASIYFRVLSGGSMDWYVIRSDSKTPENELLSPILVDSQVHQGFAAAAALGSTIYIFGGAEFAVARGTTMKCKTFNSVYCFDTNSPEKGWDRVAELEHDRADAHAVPVAGKIVVFKGYSYSQTNPPDAEIFDPEEKRCKTLNDMPSTIPIWKVTSHAVVDDGGGKQILFNYDKVDRIYSYNVKDGQYRVYTGILKKSGHLDTMAVVNGDVYIAGHRLKRGLIMAIDVSARKKWPQPVMGLENINWLPGRSTDRVYPPLHLVSIGKNKLALLWCVPLAYRKIKVCCAKMEVSKEIIESGKSIFMARNITRSKYFIDGCALSLCLPVFTTWKEEDDSADKNNEEQVKNEEKERVNNHDKNKEREKEALDGKREKHNDGENEEGEQENYREEKNKKSIMRKEDSAEKNEEVEEANNEEERNNDDKNKGRENEAQNEKKEKNNDDEDEEEVEEFITEGMVQKSARNRRKMRRKERRLAAAFGKFISAAIAEKKKAEEDEAEKEKGKKYK